MSGQGRGGVAGAQDQFLAAGQVAAERITEQVQVRTGAGDQHEWAHRYLFKNWQWTETATTGGLFHGRRPRNRPSVK